MTLIAGPVPSSAWAPASAAATLTRFALPFLLGVTLVAQAADPQAKRVTDRIRALQQEADRLAGESRTLLGELRRLEVERDLKVEQAKQADAAVAAARQALTLSTARLTALEAQREAQLPDLRAQLVDMYKRGNGGYARLLFGISDVRDLARTTRAVAALASLNEKRIAEHRATLQALRDERALLQQQARELQSRQADATRARQAAVRAVADRNALIAQIDRRRDLTAQYVGDLQVAYERIQQQLASGRRDTPVALPLAPFRGALDWPVAGRVTGRFDQTTNRTAGAAVRNGIEITTADGAPVRAVHGGAVAYADAFTGFGTLVIVDHGTNDFTLYGNLNGVSVTRGDAVEAGTELGRVATGASGIPSLYFEIRIDGRSVDPLQWLKSR